MSTRPNVLMVLFDSLCQAALESHLAELPALRALDTTSIVFERAFASSPEASPARASVLTGLDTAAHGLWTDGVALPERETTLTAGFAAQGYRSWHVGRRQLAGVSHFTTEHARAGECHAQDWAHGPAHRSRQNAYLNWLQATAPDIYSSVFPRQPNPDDTALSAAQHAQLADLPDELSFNVWAGARAVSRLEAATAGQPFFGLIGFVVGEDRGGAPRSEAGMEALDVRALRQADLALTSVLAALDAHAVRDNAIVVVTAGRGNRSARAGHATMHDDTLNVPLLLGVPGCGGERVASPVPAFDLAATLYALTGVAAPTRLQGVSLLTEPPRGWVLARCRHPLSAHQSALRTERWKLVVTHGDGVTESRSCLYDVHADPDEQTDLGADPEYRDTMEALVDQMIDARVALEDRTAAREASF